MQGKREETELTPQVVADLVAVAAGVMIPAGVTATWTAAEREEAAAWAAAEHLSASGSPVKRVPQPPFVHRTLDVVRNPAMAQAAVESWLSCKETARVPGMLDDPVESVITGAQMAITGLLALLGERPLTWQEQAMEVLAAHPEGVRPADLFALLGRSCPSGDALHEWLLRGWENGTLGHPCGGTWALKGRT